MSKKSKAKGNPTATPRFTAPPVEEALTQLARRQVRAVVALAARIVALGVLAALLTAQAPALGRARLLIDAVCGALALWPFFTALGRIYGWRIALGRAYVQEGRFADAERALLPLEGGRIRLFFDVAGEGAYWLAVARRGQGQEEEARRLFASVAQAQHAGREWGDRAREALLDP